MKTLFDLSSFLKRNENLAISIHYKGGRFYAASPSIDQHAVDLGDALEHVAEEYRRRANAMEPMRDGGKGKAGDCATAPVAKPQMMHATPQKIVWNISPITIPAAVPASQLTCPKCGANPDACGSPSWAHVGCNKCSTTWPAVAGAIYSFTFGRYKYDGGGVLGSWNAQP